MLPDADNQSEFTPIHRATPRFEWTIMIYLAADDINANEAAFNFFEELEAFAPVIGQHSNNSRVRFLLQAYTDWNADPSLRQNYKARRFEIDGDFDRDNPADGWEEDVPMGDADTMRDFIDWCKRRCPAERYLLLLWGHGTGSGMFDRDIEQTLRNLKANFPDFMITDPETEIPIDFKEITRRDASLLFDHFSMERKIKLTYTDENNVRVSEIIKIKRRVREFIKGKLMTFYDIVPGSEATEKRLNRFFSSRSILDALLENEIREGLNDNEINLLVIMGCCMQMIEFGYEIRRKCHYFVASEELIYFEGYNYAASFLAILDNPNINPKLLGIRFVQDTLVKPAYTDREKQCLVISSVNLQRNGGLAENIKLLSQEVVDNSDPDLMNIIFVARQQCRHFGETAYPQSYIDMAWFFKCFRSALGRREKYRSIRSKITTILNFFKDNYMIEKWIGSNRSPEPHDLPSFGGHGLAIYFPSSILDHRNNEDLGLFFDRESEFANLFTRENSWNDLIFAFMDYRSQNPGIMDDDPL